MWTQSLMTSSRFQCLHIHTSTRSCRAPLQLNKCKQVLPHNEFVSRDMIGHRDKMAALLQFAKVTLYGFLLSEMHGPNLAHCVLLA